MIPKYSIGDLICVNDLGLGLIVNFSSVTYDIWWLSIKRVSRPTIVNVDGTRQRNSYWENNGIRLISKA